MRVRVRAVFRGRVQGVFFRSNTQRFASDNDIDGWVRNLSDGSVEAMFEGEEESVKRALHLCEHSQPYAKIDSVEIFEEEPKNDMDGFRISY